MGSLSSPSGFELIQQFGTNNEYASGGVAQISISFSKRYSNINIFFSEIMFDVLGFLRIQPIAAIGVGNLVTLNDANDYSDGFSTATITQPSAAMSLCTANTANPAVPEALAGTVNMFGCYPMQGLQLGGVLPFTSTPRYDSQLLRYNFATGAFIGGGSISGILTPWLNTGSVPGGSISWINGIQFVPVTATLITSGRIIVQGAP